MNSEQDRVLRLDETDNVVVALSDLAPGTPVGGQVRCRQRIPAGHKVAVAAMDPGDAVVKYGQPIGVATRAVRPGDHVHTHNLGLPGKSHRMPLPPTPSTETVTAAGIPDTFDGFVRPDGRVGTRNYIGVLATVNCSASVVRMIADAFGPEEMAAFPGVDGLVALHYGGGCGMAGSGEGYESLRRVLAGYLKNPNFYTVLLVGLGCEVMQVQAVSQALPDPAGALFETLTIQQCGGVEATVSRACARIREILPAADGVRRQAVPAARLCLGLQCGGSDAWSGVTANPALGAAVDLLVSRGGTAILGETPEIYGAEHLLAGRAVRPEVAARLMARIRWWEAYTETWGGSMDNNPSPGNKAGGLTTIWEKSLGAAAKGGRSPLAAVYGYAEQVTQPGLVFMDTPGYDPVSVTGMLAGGATLVAFTTGCGSVFGAKPAPVLKLATNTAMYRRMRKDMDIDCGGILEGEATVEQMGRRIFNAILETASGSKTCSERVGMGDLEMVPWQLGAVM